MRRPATLLALLLAVTLPAVTLLTGTASAQTCYPMLMSLKPVAAQVGQTSEHEIAARYDWDGAYQVLVSGTGVTGEVFTPEPPKKGAKAPPPRVRFTVAADAQLGVRDFRIATPRGVSTLGQLVIVADPITYETPKNDVFEAAQEVALPATVCGAIERNEDVDYFKFKVEADSQLVFHVRSGRLQDKIHDLQQHSDPVITLKNSAGVDLALVDNYFFADPLLHYHFKQAGEYYLEIRDVRYQGNQYWQYSIEINDRPLVTTVHPLHAQPGSETPVELVGFNLPAGAQSSVSLPGDVPPGTPAITVETGSGTRYPVQMEVSKLPGVLEAEADNNTPATAQAITVPAAISGRIESDADLDCYAFEAKKGERFTIEVQARRLQSSLDSNLRLLNLEGKRLTENDDVRVRRHTYADSQVENWAAPADGKYVIEIRDLQLRGGADFTYSIQVTRAEPHFELEADTDKTLIPPGGHAVLYVRAYPKNGFSGPIDLAVEGLPAGVTATCGRILADGKDGCIILSAADDAKCAVSEMVIRGTSEVADPEGKPMPLVAVAHVLQETYMPGGGRGHYPVETHTVSVCEPLDILRVTLNPAEITLKPGESQKVEVTIERAEGFDKNVSLDVRYRHLNSVYGDSLPTGVSLDAKNSKTLLNGKQLTGHITLTADKAKSKAAERQLVPVMAHVSVNFVMKTSYVGPPLWVTVEVPEAEKK